ncbi:MAG: ribosomal RNA small subunit methyltransferase A [Candidatus Magasanikbacteria bacterium RIFCSPHIGHO2_01_FULL_41_23]|uniref:Ribosomal RNA small subunit methyltransferase A n=1 Tax=Candidatus Magasanikbacteria bacterium RIFCSPLOWO2_01_FULL_40_15 TaxID=1798686 RepID=A0A1F6N488_9BACT|nr:MAG: ribosomal RNA small subunit methyltransferase A [Candidatus Magasanikbacteria bacterium RIFCSPHIGHO2_01_FULL_41_23]OGH67156.1 MAG: ribosomal RNA small subunit methyltransferase A [Candidatus Magasanikbacteria bacterium RIFCSPHIGHO2_02_FULL_41_35]OGH75479.1 MAG: ribosomal RNA small subunit methyltransferase A [Candidatus Magasanikbacteria bacterium RIFCSPHIGHO2_12_FULL_41_16]OGH78692.1 MAG: ribosomal RNA small subunit methyltransferase A [Candidatus Magasanikbacteria bacterium RIFCSPLOWO2
MNYPDLLKPPVLKELCVEYNFSPSKKYGQNYLISDRPIREMITAADLKITDTIVEIGPGFGVLTLAVAPLVQKIIAYEIEKNLQPYWEDIIRKNPNIEIIWGNALYELRTPPKYKIVANLPYQITAFAFRTFFALDPLPDVIVVMVQKEVADRMCAPPGKKTATTKVSDVSALSVLVHYFGTPKLITKVSRGSFWPSPNVDSAVVAITNIRSRPDAKTFMSLVHAGFSHKRKIMLGNIAQAFDIPIETLKVIFQKIDLNEKIRAEALTLEQWEALFAMLKGKLSTD